jgi:phage terminase large subunit-like protein
MPARKVLHVADPLDELRELLAAMDPDDFEQFVMGLDDQADLDLIESVMSSMRHRKWEPLPHQIPPDWSGSWFVWLLTGGRGVGKTDAGAMAMDAHAKGPPCMPGIPGGHRMAIVAPTLGDASDACVHGPSGLLAHNPAVKETTRKGGTFVKWPNGAEAKLFGAYTKQDVERLRAGGNRCFVWAEELAAWRYLRACWNHMVLGLRIGPKPRVVASSTPKNRPHFVKILKASSTVVTRARTRDNPHLAAEVRQRYEDTYGGTRLGRQELDGELLEDVEGALWNDEQLEAGRVRPEDAPAKYRRVVVGVDPSWGTTNDECGIIVVGKAWNDQAYVLADYSIRGGPQVWADRVADAYWTHQADAVVIEQNFQGEQVKLAMGQVQHPQGKPPWKWVNASRGKALRAEPVVMLYEQTAAAMTGNGGKPRIHHVGRLALLEHQMTNWVPSEPPEKDDEDEGEVLTAPDADESETDDDDNMPSSFSPDRIDALVFAVTDLMLGNEGPAKVSRPKKAAAKRTTTPGQPRPPASASTGGRRSGLIAKPKPRAGRRLPGQ